MRFQRESLGEAASDILGLANQHYEEVSHFKDVPLAPSFKNFTLLEKAGFLYIFTARLNQKLIGYAAYIAAPHIHYEGFIQAHSDLIYMLPTYRGHAMSFFRACDQMMKEAGIQSVCQVVTEKKDFSLLLKRLGYQKLETTYIRRLS